MTVTSPRPPSVDTSSAGAPPRSGLALPDLLSGLVVLGVTLLVAWLAAGRTLAGYGTETDFIGGMVPEAARLLAGLPLESEFHPPAYVFLLGATKALLGDWFVAGKAISVVAAGLTLGLSHLFFRGLLGPWAGFGAVAGLVSSATFLGFAAEATSDIWALALYSAAFLAALSAATRRSVPLWALTGAVAVLALMTRTNNVTLILLLAIPLFQPGAGYKARGVLAGAAGAAAVAAAFLAYAGLTGSNLMPGGTYHNIALTYFTEESITWEGMVEARERFHSLYDVLTYDPAAMARGYVRDFVDVVLHRLPYLSGPVLALLFLPGLAIAAVEDRRRPLVLLFLAATAAQLGLVNLKAYEPRYHLYMAPWIGAAAAVLLAYAGRRADWPRLARLSTVGLGAAAIVFGALLSLREAGRGAADGGNPELARVLPEARAVLGPGDEVLTRKAHIGYYTGAGAIYLPQVSTPEELRAAFEPTESTLIDGWGTSPETQPGTDLEGDPYLFVGQVERSTRPEVAAMADGGLPWLERVAGGEGWALYRYVPGDPTAD